MRLLFVAEGCIVFCYRTEVLLLVVCETSSPYDKHVFGHLLKHQLLVAMLSGNGDHASVYGWPSILSPKACAVSKPPRSQACNTSRGL